MKNKLYLGFVKREAELQDILDHVPEAWHETVTELIDDLLKAGWDGHVEQIKEKFGSLRFYIPYETEEMSELIEKAEVKTAKMCIVCGKPATNVSKGWVSFRCIEHKT